MILECSDKKWDDYISELPLERQDIYFTRAYYQSEQRKGQGQVFVYEDGHGNFGIYPFIKRTIEDEEMQGQYYDIESAYGYGGPLTNNRNMKFESEFEEAFLEYCRKEHVVAEFVRFHPLIENESIFKNDIQVSHNRSTVWLNLNESLDNIWKMQISKQNRNTIRKCEKNQLKVEISNDYIEFKQIYSGTMEKVGAEQFYFFDDFYYANMSQRPEYVLFRVRWENETLAAAVFMGYGEYFHYHLSGSKKEFLKLAPNNILLWEAIRYGKAQGYKKMHFGGGLRDTQEDNLFRFKRRFSRETADFYIGKRVHNSEVYNSLIQKWEKEHGKKAELFLQYRTV